MLGLHGFLFLVLLFNTISWSKLEQADRPLRNISFAAKLLGTGCFAEPLALDDHTSLFQPRFQLEYFQVLRVATVGVARLRAHRRQRI